MPTAKEGKPLGAAAGRIPPDQVAICLWRGDERASYISIRAPLARIIYVRHGAGIFAHVQQHVIIKFWKRAAQRTAVYRPPRLTSALFTPDRLGNSISSNYHSFRKKDKCVREPNSTLPLSPLLPLSAKSYVHRGMENIGCARYDVAVNALVLSTILQEQKANVNNYMINLGGCTCALRRDIFNGPTALL